MLFCHGPRLASQIITLLHELIAAKTSRSKYVDSKAMHSVAQRFNTEVRYRRAVDVKFVHTDLVLYQAGHHAASESNMATSWKGLGDGMRKGYRSYGSPPPPKKK